MTGFPINPPRAPIADSSGNVTPEWYRYFAAIQRSIGGSTSSPFDDSGFLASLPTMPTVATEGGDQLVPPVQVQAAQDPLTPPTIVPDSSDLLYPPRYGA